MAPPRKPDSELVVPRHSGQAHLHRLRAERALGKPLPPLAVVHHADGSIRDEAPLVICENRAYHNLLHARMRVKAAGGDPNTQALCSVCREVKPFEAFSLNKALLRTNRVGRHDRCKVCRADYERRRR